MRANLDRRTVDTVGRVKIQNSTRMITVKAADGRPQITAIVNPLNTVDEWAVLSDGTIAFVRGHDYHVDLIRPDGTKVSGAVVYLMHRDGTGGWALERTRIVMVPAP